MDVFVRSEMLGRRYRAIRSVSTRLCQTLTPEDCAAQSMPDASPVKWHLAHSTWFFETFLLRRIDPTYEVFHPRFEYLFNSYYNSVGAQFSRPDRGLLTRPSLEEVGDYRAHVDRAVATWLDTKGALDAESLDLVELGLNHEQQHQELLLTDVKHLLAQNPLAPVYRETKEPVATRIQTLEWIGYPGGLVEIGHDPSAGSASEDASGDASENVAEAAPRGAGFAFDNESPRHRVHLEPFELGSRAIRNGEYAAFIEDGGYGRPEFWLAEGWAKIQEERWQAPLYWVRDRVPGPASQTRERWWSFTLSGLRPVRMEEPVCHLSFFEADAFARWAGCRLPTEAEWEQAAAELPIEGNFLESGRFHPEAPPARTEHDGPLQMFGDVWEWTSSAYGPYPGFRAEEGALGEYNGKFMSSQIVLRGGSCVSPRSHLRATYRNFFPPDARWQFSGLRLARDRTSA